MSVALRSERLWLYAPTAPADDAVAPGAASHALVEQPTSDRAVFAAFAPQAGRESTVALRRTAVARAVFTVSDSVTVGESWLCRLARTGTLYTVTGLRAIPVARELLVDAESVDRGTYTITADVEAYTVATVGVVGPLTLSVGSARYFRASLLSQAGTTLADRPVAWASSNTEAVWIDAQGRAEGMAPGSAVITATSGGVSGQTTVTVNP